MLSANRKRITLLVAGAIILIFILHYALEATKNSENNSNLYDANRDPKTPVLVTVYYEALCPDSKHFIIDQLVPAYRTLNTLMDISLVPYGKATTYTNRNGSYHFDCQHGATECQANTYHACAIDTLKSPQRRLEVVACMIKDNHSPRDALHRCMLEEESVDTDLVQKCYDNTRGMELLKMHGDATNALRPSVSFIPTVTLDGSQGRQPPILKDLTQEICRIMKGSSLAAKGCAQYSS